MFYKCEDCDITYKTKKSLREHIKIKHSAIESLECSKCNKHFLNKLSLNKHLYRVHPSKLHSCTFCGSSFKVRRKYLDFIINCLHYYGIFSTFF